jgi:hypothetical protein
MGKFPVKKFESAGIFLKKFEFSRKFSPATPLVDRFFSFPENKMIFFKKKIKN